jgi:predicted glycosyltransferase
MNREAAALGVPAYTIFAGPPAAIDQYLIDTGRLAPIRTSGDVAALKPTKKKGLALRGNVEAKARVVDLILEKY